MAPLPVADRSSFLSKKCPPHHLANLHLGSNTESHYSESTTNHDETKPPSGVANHQNTESYSAAAKKRRSQNTRIPNRTRGRATDRRVQFSTEFVSVSRLSRTSRRARRRRVS